MKRILVAVSGGIDSLVTSHLLKRQGHAILPVHFRTGFEGKPLSAIEAEMAEIGRQLGEEVRILDLSEPFSNSVIAGFRTAYEQGLTPNPCLMCNPAHQVRRPHGRA